MERSRTMSEDGNGVVKLPIGFRFHPTDEELVVHYLKRKVFSLSLPANVIPEFNVFHSNPWDLPGDSKEKRYFFSKKEWNHVVKKSNSSLRAGCGYWKAIGKDKQIVAPGTNLVIGIKKSSVFYKGKNSGPLKTQWVMHEFSLVGSVITPCLTQKLMIQMGDWVICRLFQRKRKGRNNRSNAIIPLANIKNCKGIKPSTDHLNSRIGVEDGSELGFSFSAISSSSCPSGITEISSNDLEEEASSLNNNISF